MFATTPRHGIHRRMYTLIVKFEIGLPIVTYTYATREKAIRQKNRPLAPDLFNLELRIQTDSSLRSFSVTLVRAALVRAALVRATLERAALVRATLVRAAPHS